MLTRISVRVRLRARVYKVRLMLRVGVRDQV